MQTISTSSHNTESDIKPKKMLQNKKKKSNKNDITFSNINKTLKGEISSKLSTDLEEKLEKNNIIESNKIGNILKETSLHQKKKVQKKENSFIPNLQDFPELKVHKNSNLSEFSAENNIKVGYDKYWGNRQKKSGELPSLLPEIISTKSKTDICSGPSQLAGNNIEGSCDVNKNQFKMYLSNKDPKEKQVVSFQEISTQTKRNPNKKKRADPILINLVDISNINKNRTRTKSRIFLKSKFKRRKDTEQLAGNYLDSSNPKRLRGKHREVKKKRLSNLKLAIIKERIVKQKLREKSAANCFGSENTNVIDNIDFKTEIKVYLKELSERKAQLTELSKNKVEKISCNVNKEVNSCEKNKDLAKIIPSITPEGLFKFSSKFREYCDNIITPDLNSAVANLIKESVNLQDRSFLQDPMKARARKRHVLGLREVKKYLNLKKVKLIIIAPNLEKLQMEGNLYDVINDLKSTAQIQNVPYAFALDRYKLGKFTKKYLPISAFAILTYEGIEGLFFTVKDLLKEAKTQFGAMVKANSKVEDDVTAEVNSKIIASFISAFRTDLKISGEKTD